MLKLTHCGVIGQALLSPLLMAIANKNQNIFGWLEGEDGGLNNQNFEC